MRLPPFTIERYFAEHEFSTPHLLCASDLESLSLGELCALEEGALDELGKLWLGYTEPQGDPGLREAIIGLYDSVESGDVIVHSGGVEAIFTAMNALLEPGDRVVVQLPSYQCLHEVARGLGAGMTPWRLDPAASWIPDLASLDRLLATGARAVVVNYPHNPTGTTLSTERWQELVELVGSHGAVLFSDEAYRFSEYRAEDRLPSACDLDNTAVSMGLLSKAFGLPGLRVAWLATKNEEVKRRVSNLKDYTTICSSAPSEYLAGIALRHRDHLLGRNVDLEKRNLEILRDCLGRYPHLIEWTAPLAGPICFPRWRGPGSVDDLVDEARDIGVLLLPGSVFDMPEFFRIGFGRASFPQALEAFEPLLRAKS